ncbi:PAN2-PAN3 deadenylation complex subunit pan3-like [Anneissia japonica]|uniref:PAN2-PAN3 deadenylation complex subunit pan3-like n=1 Tax=Anneissia japonica TaxID=1529436 RepID=UPI001425B272|nr:PAN2-PAN3 deadenylation complex subunit pan3-like [Anneissia japonica]
MNPGMNLDQMMITPDLFTGPFNGEISGRTTSKFQHLMQNSHPTTTGGGDPVPRDPSIFMPSSLGSTNIVSEDQLSSHFSGMSMGQMRGRDVMMHGMPNPKASEFIPGMQGQHVQGVPGSHTSEFLPGTRNVPTTTTTTFSEIPEFVPRGHITSSHMQRSGGMLRPSVSATSLTSMGSSEAHGPYSVQIGMGLKTSASSTALTTLGSDLTAGSLSAGASPLHSPAHSPGTRRKELNKHGSQDPSSSGKATIQENIGGTTYFYTEQQLSQEASQLSGLVLPNFHMYPSVPPHVAYMKQKPHGPSFFMGEDIKVDILHRHLVTLAQIDPAEHPDIPQEVDKYHTLYPLEVAPKGPMDKNSTFGYSTQCFKAVNSKDNKTYCLRRVIGFKVANSQWMTLVDMWKKLQHSNVVSLREVFTTKAFGEHSMVFVHDYHPGAMTLMQRHFHHKGRNSFMKNRNGPRASHGLLPENLLWTYIVQISSTIRSIHAAGLACRVIDPRKVLITARNRLRLNCVGIFDVLTYNSNQGNLITVIPHYQQDDLMAFGRMVLALACNSLDGLHRDQINASLELVSVNYSSDLKNLILYLLTTQGRPKSINDIMPMIGARFYTQLDAAYMRSDSVEEELAKEVQNGRLFRLIAKFGVINERPEFNGDPAWSETGDRYLLKLFRDYLFHQVNEAGAPWIDMAHIVHCLNKLDAGVPEKVCLMSRDDQNVLVVSYADLKHCFETTFEEVLHASRGSTQIPDV